MTIDQAPDVCTLVREQAVRHGDRRAFAMVSDLDAEDGTRWLTYAELDERARSIAVWLSDQAPAGSRVLLLFPAGVEFVAGLLGCLYAGLIAVPAPVPGPRRHERERLRRIADSAGVAVVLTESAAATGVAEWVAEWAPSAVTGVTDEGAGADPGRWRPPASDRDTVAVLQYTSGSTAEPKGAVITHGNVLSNLASLARAFGLDETTRFGGWIPNYHDMGLMGHIMPPLLLGAQAVLMSPGAFLRRPHHWLRMIDRFGVTFSAAPDFAYELCCRRVTDEQAAGLDLSSWRVAANGSEPIKASVLAAFTDRFAPYGFRAESMVPCFGMAEATVFVSGTSDRVPVSTEVDAESLARNQFVAAKDGRPRRVLVSCGAVHGVTVRVVDPATGRVLPAGEVGEIWLRGGGVAAGYWRDETATSAGFGARTTAGEGPFLRTGDLGLLHDGELYVTGRIKEVLVIRGRNLYPQDVEIELRARHQDLGSGVGAVFTVPTAPVSGRDGEALIVTHEVRASHERGHLASLAGAMRQTVAQEFGVRAAGVLLLRPGGVRRTTSGKIQRLLMRDLYLAGALDAVHVDDELGPRHPSTAGRAE